MKNILSSVLVLSLLFLANCEDSVNSIPLEESIAIQAYLYAGEPVDDIRLNSTVPLDVDTSYAPPINDAEVYLIKNGVSYELELSAGDSGYYHYPDSDLVVESGDVFQLYILYQDHEITATTIVPAPPVNLTLSDNEISVPDFSSGDFTQIREWMDRGDLSIDVSWEANGNDWFYVTLENIEDDPEEIETMQRDRLRRRIFPPISDTQYQIRQMELTHLGDHQITVYSVNIEYADLYSSRNQDSRDLQEPLTNIEGGLGVFTSFASATAYFTVTIAE